jgi:hypothetical protein
MLLLSPLRNTIASLADKIWDKNKKQFDFPYYINSLTEADIEYSLSKSFPTLKLSKADTLLYQGNSTGDQHKWHGVLLYTLHQRKKYIGLTDKEEGLFHKAIQGELNLIDENGNILRGKIDDNHYEYNPSGCTLSGFALSFITIKENSEYLSSNDFKEFINRTYKFVSKTLETMYLNGQTNYNRARLFPWWGFGHNALNVCTVAAIGLSIEPDNKKWEYIFNKYSKLLKHPEHVLFMKIPFKNDKYIFLGHWFDENSNLYKLITLKHLFSNNKYIDKGYKTLLNKYKTINTEIGILAGNYKLAVWNIVNYYHPSHDTIETINKYQSKYIIYYDEDKKPKKYSKIPYPVCLRPPTSYAWQSCPFDHVNSIRQSKVFRNDISQLDLYRLTTLYQIFKQDKRI